jgi:hypothetical protein
VLSKAEKKFNEINAQISDEIRKVLDEIWRHNLLRGKWIKTSALFSQFETPVVMDALRSLNASIVKEFDDYGRRRCYLSFLGILLTSEGQSAINLLEKYLVYSKKRLLADSECSGISSDEIYTHYSLSEKEQDILTRFIWRSPFKDGGSGGNTTKWSVGFPYEMENELVLNGDIREFLFKGLLEQYDEKVPALYDEREAYLNASLNQEKKSAFWFIKEPKLKKLIETDWEEIQRVYRVDAWKSTILLCGGVLEGILINELSEKEADAKDAYLRIRNNKEPQELNRWQLIDLVDITKELDLFPTGAFHLTHAVREYRNLIHPGKQLREDIEVTEEQAAIVFNAVKSLLIEKNK